ncbi:MAG: AAA family ATPase [Cocleimonas sp.]|nr:AAA family ATPase [Cocleimonas sp.]
MISVIGNLKGGTGKSTVTFNLSLWVATHRNVHVAVYDFDPQATLTDALEIRSEDGYQPSIIPKSEIGALDEEGEHTEVLIDIGMSDMDAMKQAISKADRVIVPVAPSQADVWSTQRFISMVVDIRGSDNLPDIIGFMNRADTHVAVRETDEAFDALSTLDNMRMLDERLYQRTAYRRSFSEGLAVFEMDSKSKASQEIEALGKILY